MKGKRCKWCNNAFNSKERKGADQEYCEPNHRRYENQLHWLLKKKAKAMGESQEMRLDDATKQKIDEAVHLTVKHYGETLRKLAKK